MLSESCWELEACDDKLNADDKTTHSEGDGGLLADDGLTPHSSVEPSGRDGSKEDAEEKRWYCALVSKMLLSVEGGSYRLHPSTILA